MGMERWYVAVVDGGYLLQRALSDPPFGENLMLPSLFGPERHRYPWGGLHAELRAEVDAMNRLHPGIENRIYTLDRLFDMLHYLLSEPRRRGEFDGDDPGTKAILGTTQLPEHLRGGQGHPMRYSPPAVVREIAAWLEGLAVEDLRAAYAPEKMEEQCVYKFWAGGDYDETRDRIIHSFEGLREFYSGTASNGEGVLTIVT